MIVIGINLGETAFGKPLRDGGCCAVSSEGILFAIAEERLTRQKAAGGFKRSLQSCISELGLNAGTIDLIVYSTCCEKSQGSVPSLDFGIAPDKVIPIPSHHLSHAYSASLVSPFDEALVMVLDGGGNIVDDRVDTTEWWRYRREQQSYYLARGKNIQLIDRDFEDAHEAGVGELYRAFTKYLGWDSYAYSGKTMALSALGNSKRFEHVGLFYFDGDRMRSRAVNTPMNPIEIVTRFATENQLDWGKPRESGAEITDLHADIAHYIQQQSELAIIEKLRKLCKQTGMSRLCVAGGVGLNCLINMRILEETPIQELFVQPAAGDQGQCLGNALYGLFNVLKFSGRLKMEAPFFGPQHSHGRAEIEREVRKYNQLSILQIQDVLSFAADVIAEGQIVGWYQGRSEFGPRALGNRSILADPRRAEVKNRLNQIVKSRESFMPFAPSILEEYVSEYFDPPVLSPFMLLAPRIRPEKADLIPAVTHVDGSARLHTVSRQSNPRFYEVINRFHSRTGVPILLNTSLNVKGQPICETPADAIECCATGGLNYLFLEDMVIQNLDRR